jgi:thiosulfate/3-mercaptopyruvate sulfurtransferase
VDVDSKLYAAGHIPGAVGFDWATQLQDQVSRDIISREHFERLLSEAGIKNSDTVIIYGDSSNWFAAYGFWLFKLYGHKDVRLLNGGRAKWLNEKDLPLTTDVQKFPKSDYEVSRDDTSLRARVADVIAASGNKAPLVDVRSPDEFSGKVIAPPGMSESAQRGGHIPGATSIPWGTAVTPENTFKSADELRAIYLDQKRLDPGKATIAYCRIGERSSHTWFVLKYLLGFKDIRNYDGSWTEYGNLIGAPIEKP